jgi:ribosomal protein L35AE/L33A
MDIQTINNAIIHRQWSNEDLMSMQLSIQFARKQLTQRNKAQLTVGDSVNFTSTKTGQNITGVIVKIAIKYVTVRTVQGLWKVPANMLNKVEDFA